MYTWSFNSGELFQVTRGKEQAYLVAQMVKSLLANSGHVGLIPGSGSSPGEENGNPLQYSCLENPVGYSPWGHKELDTTE